MPVFYYPAFARDSFAVAACGCGEPTCMHVDECEEKAVRRDNPDEYAENIPGIL
jgi:hypothetical protein